MSKNQQTSAAASFMPGPSPETEAQKLAALKKHRRIASGMLILAAIIFLGCEWHLKAADNPQTWVRFLKAASEAGMVGGLADWFAVTALFRYPLGIKIPHTAIVRRKKDQVGESLSDFVNTNFLNSQQISQKIVSAEVPAKLGDWLAQPSSAEKVSAEAGTFVARAMRSIDSAEAEELVRKVLLDKAAEPQWGPPLGRLLQRLLKDGHINPLVDEAVGWMHRKAVDSEELVARLLDERAPSWAPRFVNDLVGDKVYREVVAWTAAVQANPNHEARKAIRRFLESLAQDLQHDPDMIARVEEFKHNMLQSEGVTEATSNLWNSAEQAIIEAVEDPNSAVRQKIAETAMQWGRRIKEEPELRESLEQKLVRAAVWLVDNYGSNLTAIIGETIAKWDAEEASDKIELMVGKDLQYIRMNGTIVGALAGLAIYTVSFLLFGV